MAEDESARIGITGRTVAGGDASDVGAVASSVTAAGDPSVDVASSAALVREEGQTTAQVGVQRRRVVIVDAGIDDADGDARAVETEASEFW